MRHASIRRLTPRLGLSLLIVVSAVAGCSGSSNPSEGDGGPGDAGSVDGGQSPVCGDGVRAGDEACDDGNATPGDGCEADCTFTCVSDDACDDGVVCNGAEHCSPESHVCEAGAPAQDGTDCPTDVAGDADGGMMSVLGRCIAGQCSVPCSAVPSCDDQNPCNGVETCDSTYQVCAPGTPLDCDDGEVCTEDTCDTSPAGGCVHTLTPDADGDGVVAEGVTCTAPELMGDCDDGDPDVKPGLRDVCDGKDNDCDGEFDEDPPTYYRDCDGDGYAKLGAASQTQCTEPAPGPSCGWTTRDPSAPNSADCQDYIPEVNPGQTQFMERPYCAGAGLFALGDAPNFYCTAGVKSWDYNCDGMESFWHTWNVHCSFDINLGANPCYGSGWDIGTSPPGCGQTAAWAECAYKQLCPSPNDCHFACDANVSDRAQRCK